MTQKDFKALAAALKETMPVYTGDKGHADYAYHCEEYGQWKQDVVAVLMACEDTNPKFHKGKFIAACGIPNIEHVEKLKQEIINYHKTAAPENDEGE